MHRESIIATSLESGASGLPAHDSQLMKLRDIIDWQAIDARLAPLEARPALTAPAALHGKDRMFRVLLLAHWHGLGDEPLAQALRLRLDFRQFAGFAVYERTPGAAAIDAFRAWFAAIGLLDAGLADVVAQLGLCGLEVRAAVGAIVELTVVDADQAGSGACASAGAVVTRAASSGLPWSIGRYLSAFRAVS
ncbi:transposase [Derxia lacustris]|uniref:transposase n=1 Tax=Derxia lacustris TaxID=764842 RepID=UPI000A16D5B8|nr:transposase [Derxia lacustris]